MKSRLSFAVIGFSLLVSTLFCSAANESVAFGNDGIDRSAPNFVTASLLIMSPGDELWACSGHSMLRMECPTFNLDYCFSYESESVKDKLLSFFRGKLRMGLFSLPTANCIAIFRKDGRRVMQYSLNLPPEVKQRLWKILDDRVSEGADLPYDYLKRGCSQSLLVFLREALGSIPMQIPQRFRTYNQTRRDSMDLAVSDYPWNRFFLHVICGTEMDVELPRMETVVIPNDLLDFLKQTRVNGTLIVDTEGVELSPLTKLDKRTLLTPMLLAWVFVAFAMVNLFLGRSHLNWLFIGLHSAIALPLMYLVFFTDLPATDWNWLIVPFNLLPLIFWKWRQKWALWFAGVLLLWEAGMILWPHRLTDPAYLVLVGAYILFYLKFTSLGRVALLRDRSDCASPRDRHIRETFKCKRERQRQ